MTTATTPPTTEGERRRDVALARAARGHDADIWRAHARMIREALGRNDCTFTSDDATPPGETYNGSAGWLGSAVRRLGAFAWVELVGHVKSGRASRKANYIRQWRVTDRDAAERELRRLRRLLAALEEHETGSDCSGQRTLWNTEGR